jgi:Fe2+ or Zn2+ uptake regulation protein
MRLTKHRQDILRLLSETKGALSAAQIHASLPHINLVTIYRGLEYFTQTNTIKKLHFGEQEAQYEIQKTPHHHAICTDCNTVLHFTLDEAKLRKILSLPNFEVKNLELTVRGNCTHKHPTS